MLADVGMPSLQGLWVIRLGIDFQLPGMILLSMMTWTVPATGPMEMPGLLNGAGRGGKRRGRQPFDLRFEIEVSLI